MGRSGGRRFCGLFCRRLLARVGDEDPGARRSLDPLRQVRPVRRSLRTRVGAPRVWERRGGCRSGRAGWRPGRGRRRDPRRAAPSRPASISPIRQTWPVAVSLRRRTGGPRLSLMGRRVKRSGTRGIRRCQIAARGAAAPALAEEDQKAHEDPGQQGSGEVVDLHQRISRDRRIVRRSGRIASAFRARSLDSGPP